MGIRKVVARSGLGGLLPSFLRPRVAPTATAGVGGTRIVGGYIISGEKDSTLSGVQKYTRYAEILANISIVGAAVRNFLNLVSSVSWKVEPNPDGGARAEEVAETIEKILDDMTTPWHRVVRKAAMYKFHGFSMQEWTAKRREDGAIGFKDIESRPCFTIERWDVDEGGTVHGVLQVAPNTGRELYIPRAKLLYMVDDTLADSPEGLGLFRHLIAPAKRLQRYEQLEGFGFETDLKGIPLGRAPLDEMQKKIDAKTLSPEARDARLASLGSFLENHIKTPSTALMLDSETFRALDESSTPSAVRMWDLELLKGEGSEGGYVAMGAAIMRVVRDIARVLSSEHLLLGESGAGSLAMHKDKTSQFSQMVDSAITEVVEGVEADLLPVLFALNGWGPELMPVLKAESVAQRDVVELTDALAKMATAGVMLGPDEEAIGEIFDLMGLTRPTKMIGALDMAIQTTEAKAKAGAASEDEDEEASGAPKQKPTPTKKWHRARGRLAKRS